MNSISQDEIDLKEDAPATIYFFNIDHKSVVVDHYHNNRFIGKLEGKKYLKYETQPGKNLFWIAWTNKVFITSNLKPGGIYFIIEESNANAFMFDAKLSLTPITEKEEKLFKKAKKYIKNGVLMENPIIEVDETNINLSGFISKILEQYENDTINKYKRIHISPEMAIPPAVLK